MTGKIPDQSPGSRIARLGGYLSWSVADHTIFVAVPRLLIFPILAGLLGDQAFGSFVLALGFVHLIGVAPSTGLWSYVIRDLANHDHSNQQLLMRSVGMFCLVAVLPFSLFFIFGANALASSYSDPSLALTLPALAIYLLLTNLVETMLTAHRVHRSFRFLVVVHSVQTLFLLLAIPLYWLAGMSGVASAYVLASGAALSVVLVRKRSDYLKRPLYSPEFIRSAMRVWLPLSGSAFLFESAGYLDRILLGYWWSSTDVAVFFAAAGTAKILMFPSVHASRMILSLLGRVRHSERFTQKFYALYGVGALVLALVLFLLGSLLGRPILSILYPSLMNRALPLWNYAAAAAAAMSLYVSCRPFVLKFLSPNIIPVLAVFSVIGRIIPIILLVPSGGSLGAVQAMAIGSLVTGLAWLIAYLRGFVFTRGPRPLPDFDDGAALKNQAAGADNDTAAEVEQP